MPVSGLILVWYSVMNIIDNYRKQVSLTREIWNLNISTRLNFIWQFAVMLAIGVPITFAIGLSSLLSIITALPPMPPFLLFHKK